MIIYSYVRTSEGYNVYDTEEAIFKHVSENLSGRFWLAFTAPCCNGQLFDDIGFLGNIKVARKTLEGTYIYPSDTDAATQARGKQLSRILSLA